MKNKALYKIRMFVGAFGALAFTAIVIWLLVGLDRTNSATQEQRIKNVKQAVMNGAVLCYSTEGFYPDSIEYLKDNYGLNYDDKRYLVDYRYVSADTRPSVMVYDENVEKESAVQ